MKTRVIRRDYAQGNSNQEQNVDEGTLLLDRLIYRKMGSLTDNKLLTTPASSDTDFHRWLKDMDNLWNYKYYPGLHALSGNPIPTPDLIALDEYLGSLGITEIYPFSQDTFYQPPWLKMEEQEEYRQLVDETDMSYLVDSTDNTRLVYYT